MKLQPREQAIIGGSAIVAVLICGCFGVIGGFGIFPQWDKFTKVQTSLSGVNAEVTTQETTLTSLKAEKQTLIDTEVTMPEGKDIGKIMEGGTIERTKRELLNTVIEMGQSHDNILVSAKPGTRPPAPPPDPNNPSAPSLSTYVDEVPYEITIRGNYIELNGFINELSEYDTVIEIADLKINPEKDNNTSNPQKPLKAEFKINYLINKG